MEVSACSAPLTVERGERPVTRGARRQRRQSRQVSVAAKTNNDSSLLTSLPSELLLRVASALLQQQRPSTSEAELCESTRRAKDIAALICTCRRFAGVDFRTSVSRVVREEVHHMWNGSELSKLPAGCTSWLHLLWLLEEQTVAVSFRWRIENWAGFQQDAANRTYGAAFGAGGFSWRLLLFPRGNTVPFLSLYLAVTSDFQQRLLPGWVKFCRFALIVPNRTAPALVKMTQHQFDSRENDWGFTQLLELADLADPAKGWIGDDGSLTVEVLVLPSLWAPTKPYVTLSWTGDVVTAVDSHPAL